MNRRRLILTAAGAAFAIGGIGTPTATGSPTATDDELAFANFGLATELLLKDFYARTAAANLMTGRSAREVARGAFNAGEHVAALSALVTGAGQTPALEEDFEFAWPTGTFATRKSATAAGLAITRALLGVYQSAVAVVSVPSYRTLFASMAANLAQQAAFLSLEAGGRIVGVSFPPIRDLEAASEAVDAYLG